MTGRGQRWLSRATKLSTETLTHISRIGLPHDNLQGWPEAPQIPQWEHLMLFQKNRINTFQKNKQFNLYFGLCTSHSRTLNGKAQDTGKNTSVLGPLGCSTPKK